MAADVLVRQGAKASAAMVLTLLSQNILVSAPEGLINVWQRLADFTQGRTRKFAQS